MRYPLKATDEMILDYHRLMIVLFCCSVAIGIGASVWIALMMEKDSRFLLSLIVVIVILVIYLLFILLLYPHPYKVEKELESYGLDGFTEKLNNTYLAHTICYANTYIVFRKRKLEFIPIEDLKGILIARMRGNIFHRKPWFKITLYGSERHTYRIYNEFSNQSLALFLDAVQSDFPHAVIGYNWLNYQKYIKLKNQLEHKH